MFVQERYATILAELRRRPRWGVTRLQRTLNVSRSTLRRDLLELEQRGEVVRVHGGVMHRDYLRGEPTFGRRSRQAVSEKRAIAIAAAALVQPNSTVYLDAGTTSHELGRLLMLRPDLKLFTHSIRLVADAAGAKASMVCVGGEYRETGQALVGALGLKWLADLKVDIAFLAASGLSRDGLSTTELSEAAMKQAVMKSAAKKVLLADAAKWETSAAVRFAGWDQFDMWVVSPSPGRAARECVESQGVQMIIAKQGNE